MAQITIEETRCKGCALCVAACPKKILRLADRFNVNGYQPCEVTDMSECTGCASCARMCPDCVIEVYR